MARDLVTLFKFTYDIKIDIHDIFSCHYLDKFFYFIYLFINIFMLKPLFNIVYN
jgi:hypothetical protein